MINCDREKLLEAVSALANIVPRKTPKPVLENLLLRARDSKLNLFATDLEVGMKVTLEEVEVVDEEEILLPAAKLLGILRESESEMIKFELEDNFCKITAGEDQYKVFSLSATEFPQLASFPDDKTFTVNSQTLRTMLKKVSFSAATEATRYTMNSVLFDIKGGLFRVIATDGKRLAFNKSETDIQGEYFLLLPIKGVGQMEKILPNREEEVSIFIEDNQFLLKVENMVLNIRLLQGTYPPYENVIPKGFPIELHIGAEGFLKSLKKSALLTTQESKSVRLHFEKDELTLYSNDPNVGEAKIPVPLENEIPEPLDISFNPVLFMDVLKVVDGDEVALKLKDSTSPGIIHEGEDYLYVVMPLNI